MGNINSNKDQSVPPRRNKWWLKYLRRGGFVLLGLIVIMIIISCSLATYIHLYGQNHQDIQDKTADVIVVLGISEEEGIRRRTAHALELWRAGIAEDIICTGGPTLIDNLPESEVCRQFLLEHNVPQSHIFTETTSCSTEENAQDIVQIMQAQGWQDMVLVSDNYHLWRANLIFGEQSDWHIVVSAAQNTQPDPPIYLYALAREVAATYWHIGKGILGLDVTRYPPGSGDC